MIATKPKTTPKFKVRITGLYPGGGVVPGTYGHEYIEGYAPTMSYICTAIGLNDPGFCGVVEVVDCNAFGSPRRWLVTRSDGSVRLISMIRYEGRNK